MAVSVTITNNDASKSIHVFVVDPGSGDHMSDTDTIIGPGGSATLNDTGNTALMVRDIAE